MKLRRRLLVLLAALPLLSACNESKEDTGLPTPPIILPFEVWKAGVKVGLAFRIEEPNTYRFKLQFRFNDPAERERVARLVGHPDDRGILIPLRIRVDRISAEEEIILDKQVSQLALYGFTADRFDKKIVDTKMQPGYYRLNIESLQNNPALQGTQIDLAIVRAYVGK